jgi:CubicO group peptidase (beta-lactamase class C family)
MTHAPTRAGLDRLHDAMADRVARGELPGLVTLVGYEDDVHVDPIGTLAFGRDEPMRRDTLFRIASLTKPVVAATALTLVDDGVLTLDEPVDRFLPELADRRVLARIDGPLDETVPALRPNTLDDLLSMRMGFGMLTEPTFNPPFPIVRASEELDLELGPPVPRTPHPPDEWMRRFGTLPLMVQPGERWQYNVSFMVLGVLIARAAGQPLDEVVRARMLEPLGMADTGFALPADEADRLPVRYMTDPTTGTLERQDADGADLWTRPAVFPSGSAGLLSTVDDYQAFAQMLANRGRHKGDQVLSEQAVRLMTTNRLTAAQVAGAGLLLNGLGWGYGVSVSVVADEISDTPGRYGWDGGSGTTWCNDPASGRIAIALSQTSDFIFNGSREEFARLALHA